MLTFLIFFIILSILILSHEFGHFLAAKKTNTKVEEFGFGFPPKIIWKKIGETVYSFNLFPIGGFVKILGENGKEDDGEINDRKRNFYFKPAWVKALILVSGVLFNLLAAWTLISVSLFLGSLKEIDDSAEVYGAKVVIVDVQKGSPADSIGIKAGDILNSLILENKTFEINRIKDVQNLVNENKAKEIEIVFERDGEIFTKKTKLREIEAEQGSLGVAMARAAIIKEPAHKAVIKGLRDTISLTAAVFYAIIYFIAGLFKGVGFEQVAGPIGIYNIIGKASQLGVSYLTQIAAILSINLAIINILPFPALDGGRLLFVIIEKIKGSPLNEKAVNTANFIGFAALIILMALVTYKDILRLI